MEKSLVDKCLKRAIDSGGIPFTVDRLVERCSLDISYEGPDARTSLQMKGVRGYGKKKSRRLLPSGPPGEIQYASDGLLHIDFPSVALLVALRGQSAAHSAVAIFYTKSFDSSYPQQMQEELAAQFARENIDVEIDPDVVEALLQNYPPQPLGNAFDIIFSLLEVEHIARKRRWKRVDLAKWISAGMTWPLVRLERTRPASPKAVASEAGEGSA